MPDRRHRQTHTCPQCGYKFKNFKWRKVLFSLDIDVAAACPNCKTFAYEWARIRQMPKEK